MASLWRYDAARMIPRAKNPILWRRMLAGGVVAALLAWFGLRNHEPVYLGKTLTDWLYDKNVFQFMANDVYGHIHNELWEALVAGGYAARELQTNSSYWTRPGEPEDPALVATRQIGTNSIPWLLELLRSRPGLLERGRDLAGNKLPIIGSFLYRNLMFQTAEGRRIAAWKGFCALGTNAESALPMLSKMLQRPDADFLLGCTIAGIGPKGRNVLLAALTSTNVDAIDVAAFTLGLDTASRTFAVPALVRLMERPRDQASYHVLGAIGRLGGYPELVIPALTRFLEGTDPAGGFITESMAMLVLGLYGEQSRSAVPILLKNYEDPDATTRQLIRVVLKHIDPDHVEKLLGRAPSAKDDEDPWWGGPVE